MSCKAYGHAGGSSTPASLSSVTHTARYLVGPPSHGGSAAQGIYVRQSEGAGTPEYRWIEDQPLPVGQTSPTTFTAGNF